jgi:hypothetical protein
MREQVARERDTYRQTLFQVASQYAKVSELNELKK